jgi:hypothetical protein
VIYGSRKGVHTNFAIAKYYRRMITTNSRRSVFTLVPCLFFTFQSSENKCLLNRQGGNTILKRTWNVSIGQEYLFPQWVTEKSSDSFFPTTTFPVSTAALVVGYLVEFSAVNHL